MDAHFREALYYPRIRGKLAERMLYSKHDGYRLSLTVPTLLLPRPSEYDREVDRRLTPIEYVNRFGPSCRNAFGTRPFFLDATLLGDEISDAAGGQHPLLVLFGRAKAAGARPIPIVGLQDSVGYISAVRQCAHANSNLPCGVRLLGADLEDMNLRERIEAFLEVLNVDVGRCVLFIDFADGLEGEVNEIAENLVNFINSLPFLQEWLQVVFQAGSFPVKDGLRAGQYAEFERLDLPLYISMLRTSMLLRRPMFGDYGIEAAQQMKGSGGRAVAKLHYSSASRYAVEKGKSTMVADKCGNIRPVAREFIKRNIFAGEYFSEGDARIADIARGLGTHGNPAVWRYLGLDHHFTVTLNALSEELRFKSLPAFARREDAEANQGKLF